MLNSYEEDEEDDNFTKLHIAVKENRINLVESLIEKKDQLNLQTKNGITSLLLACRLPVDTEITKMLIHSGADVNIPDNNNCTPLLAACKTQKLEIVELLLKHNANVNHQDDIKYSALHYAIENNDLQLVDLLLRSGADTSLADYNGWTALMLAASNVNKEIVVQLVERGADVNIYAGGRMPVTLSLNSRDPTIFEYLWDLTDVEILKDQYELQSLMEAMLNSDWITPSKVRYLYKVLDTPGVNLNEGGYMRMLANYMAERMLGIEYEEDFNYMAELENQVKNEEDFKQIDVCGIISKLFKHGAKIIDLDIKGFLSICHRYTFDYKYKILQLFIDNNADFNNFHYLYMATVNDPEFTLSILQYCISNSPLDILECISNIIYRLDIPMLKLIKNILMLCTPSPKLREKLIRILTTNDVINSDCFMYEIFLDLDLPYNENIQHVLTSEEKDIMPELFNQVLDMLSNDRLPTLKELSRDVIRRNLKANCTTTQDYLNSLEAMHLPKFVTDIIQCNSAVCSFE